MNLAFALLDDDGLVALMTPAFVMAPPLMPAVVAMNDDLLHVAMAHAVMVTMMAIAMTVADPHLHVLRGRRSRERRHRKRQSGNSGSRESKFPHVLLLEAGFPPADTQ